MDIKEKEILSSGPDSCCSGYGPVSSSCGHDNESSGSTTIVEFLHQLSNY
jgi:hypothetical protein